MKLEILYTQCYTKHTADSKQNIRKFVEWRTLSFYISIALLLWWCTISQTLAFATDSLNDALSTSLLRSTKNPRWIRKTTYSLHSDKKAHDSIHGCTKNKMWIERCTEGRVHLPSQKNSNPIATTKEKKTLLYLELPILHTFNMSLYIKTLIYLCSFNGLFNSSEYLATNDRMISE
jgi:hypothetical protein